MAQKRNRRKSNPTADIEVMPAMLWLGFGVLLGLGLAVYLLVAGVLPGRVSTASHQTSPAPADASEELAAVDAEDDDSGPQYQFFDVLPEMEVVVPESEIAEGVDSAEIDDDTVYLLQAGSFRDAAVAEQRKVELAFLGIASSITAVSINGEFWHRVQAGPYTSTRELDQARRQLRDNGIQALPTRAAGR